MIIQIKFEKEIIITNEEGLRNFTNTAVIRNKDIHNYSVKIIKE